MKSFVTKGSPFLVPIGTVTLSSPEYFIRAFFMRCSGLGQYD